MKTIILITGLLFLTSVDAKQKYYKWTDADGNIHYSESKPENKSVSEVKVSSKKPSITSTKSIDENSSATINNTSTEMSANEKAIDEYNEKEKARVEKYQQEENCKAAKQNLATLQKTQRVRRIDPKTGESIRMDDSQRMKALASAKKLIKDVCK